ncbi:MAG TPA: tRNA ligase, partial [Lactobacillus sp.]|nr:tRNA ligase [Lactobacillus sp.]
MKFVIDPNVLELGVIIRGIEITGVNNQQYPTALTDYIQTEINQALEGLDR